jgi:hypothetical protein
MGGMSTGEVLLIAGGGILVLYLVMSNKPAASQLPPVINTGVSPATAAIQAQASTTNTEVQAGANTVNNLINSIFS